jgi:hypothetical protein
MVGGVANSKLQVLALLRARLLALAVFVTVLVLGAIGFFKTFFATVPATPPAVFTIVSDTGFNVAAAACVT